MATYRLRIKKFSPDTLPMERLGAYLTALSALVGKESGASFSKVIKGSAALKINVPDENAPALLQRIRSAAEASLENDARKGYERINTLLAEDGTSGEFLPGKGAALLKFAGASANADFFPIPAVKEPGEFSGRIIRIGGKDSTIPVTLLASDDSAVYCTASPDMARRLKKYLLEDTTVTLFGQGKWERKNGKWVLLEFKISEFQELDFSGTNAAIAGVIGTGSGWDVFERPVEAFLELRHGA
ncbi:hypothetical protein FACS1894116_14470 [Betaproteobacteria bacterium]|nr:hypothetical protein FACS1894116_14470 [Betaproteobacteria bacterium]GHU32833.1 hypothetical protein FACS189497_14550 [Betaproteobacteria bacterium]